MTELEEKLVECFDEMAVFKDLKQSNFFSDLKLPSFLRDWVLKKFEDSEGQFDIEEIMEFIHTFLPNKDEWTNIKNRIITENEHVKILTRISVDISIKDQMVSFSLPDFALTNAETIIEPDVWAECKDELVKGNEIWGVVELGYRLPSTSPKLPGKIKLVSFTDFCPYTVDLDYYKELRAEFDIHEWIDIVLMAVDYNPAGYVDENGAESEEKKLFFLRRLLPFVEKRVNLIELAPKGTGKSYVFEKISKRGWLISGGTVSRASLIYDNAKKTGGLLTRFDYVGFDEVQSITFEQPGQIQQALKHYMEFGEIKGFDAALTAEAGVIVLGNINADRFDINKNMVEHISEVFGESATLDRFHGFIPGWQIPRMTTGMIAHGWAINTEYFAEVLHELRSDLSYASIVESLISYKSNADQRDLTAVKRLCTAFLKLLFPHVQSPDDISKEDFEHYCLEPALEMRGVIKKQLCIIDPKEFNVPGKNTMPEIIYNR